MHVNEKYILYSNNKKLTNNYFLFAYIFKKMYNILLFSFIVYIYIYELKLKNNLNLTKKIIYI